MKPIKLRTMNFFGQYSVLPLNLVDYLIFKGLNREHLIGAFHSTLKTITIDPNNGAFKGEFINDKERWEHMKRAITQMLEKAFGYKLEGWKIVFNAEPFVLDYWDDSYLEQITH